MTNENFTEAQRSRTPLAPGDVVVLYDRRKRRYRVPLKAGGRFSTHLGAIDHDDLIGRQEGFVALTNKGHRLVVLRPTFRERVLEMRRQSQVIYPKDLGALLMRLDLYPGAHVAETGLGSGASAAAILRAIGPEGSLVSYEMRGDIVDAASKAIEELAPGPAEHRIVVADAYEDGFAERELDRILIDLAEPWRMVDHAALALRPGGILAAYVPTVLQIHQLGVALTQDTRWRLVETVELLERPWHVTDLSVRPEHRMVAHTGFIMTARRVEGSDAPEAEPEVEDDGATGDEPEPLEE